MLLKLLLYTQIISNSQGTTLYAATRSKHRQLQALWKHLEPRLLAIAEAEGINTPPSFDDFLWAFSIWWCAAVVGLQKSAAATVLG